MSFSAPLPEEIRTLAARLGIEAGAGLLAGVDDPYN